MRIKDYLYKKTDTVGEFIGSLHFRGYVNQLRAYLQHKLTRMERIDSKLTKKLEEGKLTSSDRAAFRLTHTLPIVRAESKILDEVRPIPLTLGRIYRFPYLHAEFLM